MWLIKDTHATKESVLQMEKLELEITKELVIYSVFPQAPFHKPRGFGKYVVHSANLFISMCPGCYIESVLKWSFHVYVWNAILKMV